MNTDNLMVLLFKISALNLSMTTSDERLLNFTLSILEFFDFNERDLERHVQLQIKVIAIN